MSQTGVSYPGKGISYTPDPAYATNNPLKFRVAQVIQVSMISMIKPNGSNSVLVIHGVNGEISTTAEALWASGTAASYALQSGQHVLLTDATTSDTFYLNADLFKGVSNVPGGVNSLLQYGTEGAQFKSVTVVGTAATIQAAFDAVTIPTSVNSVNLVAAGTTQGDATLATVNAGEVTIFAVSGATTAATAAGVVLSAATTVGTKAIFYNSSATFFLLVYPATGGTIDSLAANAAFALPPLTAVEFNLAAANTWESSVIQSIQSVTAGGTGVTADATQFLVSTDRLNIAYIRSASNATNGVRPIATNSNGTSILFINSTANAYAQAFPPTGQNFGLGNDIPLPIPPNASVLLVRNPLSGWSIVYGFNATTQSGTASTTQTQAAGTQIYSAAINATTVANLGDAFTISRNLRSFAMTNTGAFYAQVFPPVGGTIDGLAVNLSVRVYPNSTLQFTSNDGLAWTMNGTRVVSETLVAGAVTIADSNVRATSNANIQRLAVLGTIVSVHLLPTITAVTNVVVQSQTIAAANDATDVSTIRVTINY